MPNQRETGAVAAVRSLVFVLALAAAGCRTTMMPTPVSHYDGNADPFASVAEEDRTTTSEVYIFTSREPSGEADPDEFYSDERSRKGRLAVATVDLAEGMTWEELHRAALEEDRAQDPAPKLLAVEEFGSLWITVPPVPARLVLEPQAEPAAKAPADRFLSEVNARLGKSRQKDIFIFVHGYNTEFDHNQELAAELHNYLGREGVFMTFAWPSQASLLGYGADKANARYSTRMFRLFLTFLADNTDAHRIHLLGHSAGAPIIVDAVRQLRLTHYYESAESVRARYRIGQLVLVAPDMDLGHYANAELDGLEDVPDRLTIYISTDDRALAFAHILFDFVRLGEPLSGLTPDDLAAARMHKRLDVIDVTSAESGHGSFLGHSYFHEDPWVSADLLLLLRHGVTAAERGLSRPEDRATWSFPEDYPDRVRRIAAELSGANGGAR